MACYFLVEVFRVKDHAMYKKYADAASLIIEKHQGEYLIRSSNIELVTGTLIPERIILIRFPNEQTLRDCFDSPEYLQLTPLRERSTESRALIINQ
jgi:uncharacterized protein (DUF1330 family)